MDEASEIVLVRHHPSNQVEVVGPHPDFVIIADELLEQLRADGRVDDDQVVTIGDINPGRYRIGETSERYPHTTYLHLVAA